MYTIANKPTPRALQLITEVVKGTRLEPAELLPGFFTLRLNLNVWPSDLNASAVLGGLSGASCLAGALRAWRRVVEDGTTEPCSNGDIYLSPFLISKIRVIQFCSIDQIISNIALS
jgi:hypothetical protein